MELLQVALTSIGSIVVLFILAKLMGNRQMSELSMFDYINGITIGSIAAEMATSLETDFLKPLIAMVIYAGVVILFSFISCKSMVMRRILVGKSLVLLEDGKLYKQNFKKAKLDLNEFLMQCRTNGYFDLSTIQVAFIEPNGNISFLPVAGQKPATPAELGVSVPKAQVFYDIVIDGKIMHRNLKFSGNNENWLYKKLNEQGIKDESEVFLATCDSDNNLNVFVKIDKQVNREVFE